MFQDGIIKFLFYLLLSIISYYYLYIYFHLTFLLNIYKLKQHNNNNKYFNKHKIQCLPFKQFQVLFTLFSKFFSSFPHGTCSLSVSDLYLAFDAFYHLLFIFFSFLICTPKQIDSFFNYYLYIYIFILVI